MTAGFFVGDCLSHHPRHGRARPGHPRLVLSRVRKTWMPAPSAGMTGTDFSRYKKLRGRHSSDGRRYALRHCEERSERINPAWGLLPSGLLRFALAFLTAKYAL